MVIPLSLLTCVSPGGASRSSWLCKFHKAAACIEAGPDLNYSCGSIPASRKIERSCWVSQPQRRFPALARSSAHIAAEPFSASWGFVPTLIHQERCTFANILSKHDHRLSLPVHIDGAIAIKK